MAQAADGCHANVISAHAPLTFGVSHVAFRAARPSGCAGRLTRAGSPRPPAPHPFRPLSFVSFVLAVQFLETKVPAPVVAAIAGALMLLYARSTQIVMDPTVVHMYVGVGLSQVSAVLALAAAGAMWHARTSVNPLDPSRATRLVTGGVFRLSRNPMYLGLLLLLVAYAVRLDALPVWLGPVFFIVYVTRFQIAPEERVLSQKFGEAYLQYKARTRRWI
jgi:protein-S-isoprenylcysteine O-methyltransferase Ste14